MPPTSMSSQERRLEFHTVTFQSYKSSSKAGTEQAQRRLGLWINAKRITSSTLFSQIGAAYPREALTPLPTLPPGVGRAKTRFLWRTGACNDGHFDNWLDTPGRSRLAATMSPYRDTISRQLSFKGFLNQRGITASGQRIGQMRAF